MKRSIGELNVEQMAMANCAMLQSRVDDKSGWSFSGRVFKGKTCALEFNSFQALGGHTASHKRAKLMEVNHNNNKKHACGVCGQGFGTGQALGGHMGRHRDKPIHLDFTTNKFYSVIRSIEEVVVPGVTEEGSTSTSTSTRSNSSNRSFRLFGVDINVTCPKLRQLFDA